MADYRTNHFFEGPGFLRSNDPYPAVVVPTVEEMNFPVFVAQLATQVSLQATQASLQAMQLSTKPPKEQTVKPSAAAIVAIVVVALVLIALVIRNDQTVAPVPTPAPELPPAQPTTSWLTPALGPEPIAYEPNRWWQPACDPNDPYCPRR